MSNEELGRAAQKQVEGLRGGWAETLAADSHHHVSVVRQETNEPLETGD